MPLATYVQYLRVDSTTIVAHNNPKIPACILYFYFYSIRSSMQKCIYQGFTADAVHLVADCGSQRAPRTLNNDTVTDLFVDGEFLPHARECQLEVAAAVIGGSQTAERVSTFLGDPPHQLQDASQSRFGGGVIRQLILCNIKLHRGADKALQQCVM